MLGKKIPVVIDIAHGLELIESLAVSGGTGSIEHMGRLAVRGRDPAVVRGVAPVPDGVAPPEVIAGHVRDGMIAL